MNRPAEYDPAEARAYEKFTRRAVNAMAEIRGTERTRFSIDLDALYAEAETTRERAFMQQIIEEAAEEMRRA